MEENQGKRQQMLKKSSETNLAMPNVKKLLSIALIIYFAFVFLLPFLMGKQLYLRNSRGNLEMPAAKSGTVELVTGATVEEKFTLDIHLLKEVSVLWGTYMRPNTGTVFVQLYDTRNNKLLMEQTLRAEQITEGFVSTMTADTPIDNLYRVPLLLKITSADSVQGSAVSPLMNNEITDNNDFQLYLNKKLTKGRLCFSAKGEDYIWIGLHYWQIAVTGALLLIAYLLLVWYKYKAKKHSLLLNAVVALKKYKFLICQLVERDFKAKYKRSILGVLWSFINPLLTMLVQYLVFSNLFRFDIPYYPVYLLCGIIIFNYFSEACGMTLGSIVGNASLITKVYVPKYIYPLTRVISSFINLLIAMIPLCIVVFVSGLPPTKALLLLPFILLCLVVFCLGLGLLLAAAMVFFRDVQFLWGVVSMIWMYLTPIFYPESILPQNVAILLKGNPLYYFIQFMRTCVIEGVSPEPIVYIQCFLFSISFLVFGSFVFKKTQDNFVLYL